MLGLDPGNNKRRRTSTQEPLSGFIPGWRAFARIGAVEGVGLTDEKEDLREFDRKGLTVEERRRAIARKYGKVEQP